MDKIKQLSLCLYTTLGCHLCEQAKEVFKACPGMRGVELGSSSAEGEAMDATDQDASCYAELAHMTILESWRSEYVIKLDGQIVPVGCTLKLIEIGDDVRLVERYGTSIPVVRDLYAGREIAWPFDAPTLSRWLLEGVEIRLHA